MRATVFPAANAVWPVTIAPAASRTVSVPVATASEKETRTLASSETCRSRCGAQADDHRRHGIGGREAADERVDHRQVGSLVAWPVLAAADRQRVERAAAEWRGRAQHHCAVAVREGRRLQLNRRRAVAQDDVAARLPLNVVTRMGSLNVTAMPGCERDASRAVDRVDRQDARPGVVEHEVADVEALSVRAEAARERSHATADDLERVEREAPDRDAGEFERPRQVGRDLQRPRSAVIDCGGKRSVTIA